MYVHKVGVLSSMSGADEVLSFTNALKHLQHPQTKLQGCCYVFNERSDLKIDVYIHAYIKFTLKLKLCVSVG